MFGTLRLAPLILYNMIWILLYISMVSTFLLNGPVEVAVIVLASSLCRAYIIRNMFGLPWAAYLIVLCVVTGVYILIVFLASMQKNLVSYTPLAVFGVILTFIILYYLLGRSLLFLSPEEVSLLSMFLYDAHFWIGLFLLVLIYVVMLIYVVSNSKGGPLH